MPSRRRSCSSSSFETGAGKVEKSLNRMVDNFSGRKVIQDATLMSQAVERIGGTSKLTQSELQAMGARANEAIAKMKALGMDVPPGIATIAAEVKGATSTMSKLVGAVGPLAGVVAGAFSVGAVVNFGKEILADADALSKMSDHTDLSMRYTERLADAGIEPSVGSRGDSYDNALAESVIGLFKAEVIRRKGPWRTLEAVEFATLAWVDWFNHRRLLGPIGFVPPAEYEARYYEQAAVA